jgi:hypothetical protein
VRNLAPKRVRKQLKTM